MQYHSVTQETVDLSYGVYTTAHSINTHTRPQPPLRLEPPSAPIYRTPPPPPNPKIPSPSRPHLPHPPSPVYSAPSPLPPSMPRLPPAVIYCQPPPAPISPPRPLDPAASCQEPGQGPALKLLSVAAGREEYAQQVPRDQSLLHNLMAARRKDTGQPLSDVQICAQAFTFILAGLSFSPRMGPGLLPLCCAIVCVSAQETVCCDIIWAAMLLMDV